MSINITGPIPRWQILAAAALMGTAMIIAPHVLLPDWHILTGITDGIGIAVLTSAILGLTLERWLLADVSTDIFLVAIGHHLPPGYSEALRRELIRLAAYPFLCERHILSIKIELFGDTWVRVTTMIERTMRNITQSSQGISAHIHIDEWGHPTEKSRIVDCNVAKIVGGSTGDRVSFTETVTHENLSISATTSEIRLFPNEVALLSLKSVEMKHEIDDLSFVFMRPTINPTIEVDVPPGFGCETSFGPDEESATQETYKNRRTLNGMYWPPQRMRIHWWKRSSPFDALWREFGQLKNATCVGRMSWAGQSGHGVRRDFRLLDGTYITITSTEAGDELKRTNPKKVEIFEAAWRRLGSKAYGESTEEPHGIMFASDEFFEEVEDATLLAGLD